MALRSNRCPLGWTAGFIVTLGLLTGCDSGHSQESSQVTDHELVANGIRIFGDSIFTAGGNMIERSLEPLMQRTIDSHAVGGSVMWQIRDQYRNARQLGMRTAITDGGGNDVLGARGDCQNSLTPNCRRIIDDAVAIAKDVFTQMAADGVANIVHLGCHYPMNWNNGFVQAVDYSYTALSQACQDSGTNCVIVDVRETFRGRNDLLEWDGIHPNWNGAQTFANLIWQTIQDNDIEL